MKAMMVKSKWLTSCSRVKDRNTAGVMNRICSKAKTAWWIFLNYQTLRTMNLIDFYNPEKELKDLKNHFTIF